jgi:hypothetical protein
MRYQNLQLQPISISFESKLSDNVDTEFSVGTRFASASQFVKLLPGLTVFTDVVELGNHDQLRIFVKNIKYGDSVRIKDIEIGNVTLQHYIYQGCQYQAAAKDYYKPGTEFHLDGVFELDITMPIWRWLLNHIEREIRENRT